MDVEDVAYSGELANLPTNNTSDQVLTPNGSAEFHVGVVYDYNAKGPWGRIRMEDGSYAWFNEGFSFAGGERIPEGEQVEFKVRYQDKVQAWQALGIRRHTESNGGISNMPSNISDNERLDDAVSESALEDTSITKLTGRVKWFDALKGLGFIRQDGSEEDIYIYMCVAPRLWMSDTGIW